MTFAGRRRGRSSSEALVISFRTHLQTLWLLDGLARLEGKSRNQVINKAISEYATAYLITKTGPSPSFLRNRLRLIALLQKRIELKTSLSEASASTELEQDRKQMLDEAHRYPRYTENQASLLLLSKVAGWLAATLQKPSPDSHTENADEPSGRLTADEL